MLRLVELAGLMEQGLPPCAGGVLDQSSSFLEACRAVWHDQAVMLHEPREH